MSYKFIYFDLDDTLLDHRAAEKAGLMDVYNNFPFFDNVTADSLVETYHAVNSRQWKKYSQGKVTREQLQRNRFEQTLEELITDGSQHEKVGQYYLACYRNHWQWIGGAQKVYEKIVKNYPVGILTNGFAETQRMKFEAFALYDSADHTVISEEVGVLKPHPKVFKYATDLSGYSKDEILYVGDSYSSDIEGGTNFGWDTAWYTTNRTTGAFPQAEYTFNDFQKLADLLKI